MVEIDQNTLAAVGFALDGLHDQLADAAFFPGAAHRLDGGVRIAGGVGHVNHQEAVLGNAVGVEWPQFDGVWEYRYGP